MPPVNNERRANHTGAIPKTKVRNNCNVPQEAVTPTRRDMTTNLVPTSLDWVPVSEYNPRTNHNQSRKPANNISDHEFGDLENSAFENGFGRFVQVRPLQLSVQNREGVPSDHNDDSAGASSSSYGLHPPTNGLTTHSNHTPAAVMIVNPTAINTVPGNMSQPFNAASENRNNLIRTLNAARKKHFEIACTNSTPVNNNSAPPMTNSRVPNKSVNLMNNMYDSLQGSTNNLNENNQNQSQRSSARALGDAMVAACPDAAAVERRLGQIREYIRVTSSLVDTMRNSEDEAFIEHTKEEYDEIVEMVMKLKESENKLQKILAESPDNDEVPPSEIDVAGVTIEEVIESPVEIVVKMEEPVLEEEMESKQDNDVPKIVVNTDSISNEPLTKKVTNIENEILNILSNKGKEAEVTNSLDDDPETVGNAEPTIVPNSEMLPHIIEEVEPIEETEKTDEENLKEILRQNILSCSKKLSLIEDLKGKNLEPKSNDEVSLHDVVVLRPLSVQSNGSAYSENELWQNEIKNKMEVSQQRLNALHQQQKKLLKYQAEAKHELAELSRARQSHEFQQAASHDMASLPQPIGMNFHQPNRMYAANQVGVAVVNSLTHSEDGHQSMNQQNPRGGSVVSSNADHSELHQSHDDSREPTVVHSEMTTVARDSDVEGEDLLSERGRELAIKLHQLQLEKRHMENLLTDFQKLRTPQHMSDNQSNNRYSSSEDSGDDDPEEKCNKAIKKDDPFKLMEIKAIKAALQSTKDLMRSVENYEADHLAGGPDDSFQLSNHSNNNDVKPEMSNGPHQGPWQNEGAACRVRNCLPQRHKLTNKHHSQQQSLSGPDPDFASLQELTDHLMMESGMDEERARLRDALSKKEFVRKQKKVNEEVRASTSAVPGPAERRQMELRAILAEKQKQLQQILNREKTLCGGPGDADKVKTDSRAASVVNNQSYNSEQEEPDPRSEEILVDLPNGRENNFRGSGDTIFGERTLNSLPSNVGNTYASDSDSASKCNQRTRGRWRQQQERHFDDDDNVPQVNVRHEPRTETPSTAANIPPMPPNVENHPMAPPFGHMSPNWANMKSNQDMRTNQFTQNSHSQTMDRVMDPSMFPCVSAMPYQPMNHMMMPYGVSLGCSCGCSMWGSWCWQQILLQQREIHQLREQLGHLEERWRAESASHTLNNQVPPGNRANNYWDNFRSYSRQNLLSANSKTNADGHLTVGPSHNPHPLVERSHNTLHPSSSTPPSVNTPKRNSNAASTTQSTINTEDARLSRRNIAYERSQSFSSAPDVLNVNQNTEELPSTSSNQRNIEENLNTNVNINRQETSSNNPFRNLNISNSIPEIIQSHSNNLNSSPNSFKKKSSSKLPAKNSGNRRNCALDYSQTSNINIASTSVVPNPNLASTSRDTRDKATPKLFDLLRENVYSEVTTLIGVNESHPDFLIQLFRELQMISSEPLRQKVLQSVRTVLSQYSSLVENEEELNRIEETRFENATTTTNEPVPSTSQETLTTPAPSVASSSQTDHTIVRFLSARNNEICTQESLNMLTAHIMHIDGSQSHCSKKRILEYLSKYEGARMCEVASEIIDSLPMLISMTKECEEAQNSAHSESSILQDVAGSLNLFSSSETQLHQLGTCPYELWQGHVHMIEGEEIEDNVRNNSRLAQEGKVDLISEMMNGDLAEADQTCRNEGGGDTGGQEALPDVVDTDEATPTEAEAEWLGLDRVPTRLHMEQSPENQKD